MSTNLYARNKISQQLVYYVIDGRYRKSVLLRPWLEKQVTDPSIELLELCNQIPTNSNKDKQMWDIFLFVRNSFIWTDDWKTWNTFEHWNTANETALTKRIDCEDGAIMMYVLARLKGVPAENLLIFAGDVQLGKNAKTGGHCWLAYYPDDSPFHFYILDWCYYFDATPFYRRNLFTCYLDEMFEFKMRYKKYVEIASKYKKIWLGFNETTNFKKLRYVR